MVVVIIEKMPPDKSLEPGYNGLPVGLENPDC
jgi:hypothetical protein